MRRLLSDARRYLAELVHAVGAGWNAFFFTPADPTALGLLRIAVGLLALWSLFIFGIDLHDYFGSDGWAELAAIRASQRGPVWSFWFQVPDQALRPVWIGCLAVLSLNIVGLFSRTTSVLTWIVVVSTVRRLPIALFGFDQVISPLALYLAVTGASGQSVSLDRFLRRWRQARSASRARAGGRFLSEPGAPVPSISANLALRLIQLHVTLIYAMAGLGKLQGPSWWNGTAIWRTMTAGEFVVGDFTPLADWPLFLNLLTHAILALELLYPILIWFRIARPLVVAAAVVMHLGIAVVSPGLTEFTMAMLAANLAFVSGNWLRGLAIGPGRPALRVLYDGACPRCRASMALITAADPDQVIEPVDLTAVDVRSVHPSLTPEACLRSMHAVSASGSVTAGFDAVRSITGALPLFWPCAVVASLPGVAMVGRRAYNHLADARPRDVPCTDDTCGIHSGPSRAVPRPRGHVPVPDPPQPVSAPTGPQEVTQP